MGRVRIAAGVVIGSLGLLAGLGAKAADGYPPFYGYSGYYGGPTAYYTHDPDVQQVTAIRDAYFGFGVRTYTTGGPFWSYRSSRARNGFYTSGRRYHHARDRAIRVRG